MPITAETEQYFASLFASFLGILSCWNPLTTSLWASLRLPNINTNSLHL